MRHVVVSAKCTGEGADSDDAADDDDQVLYFFIHRYLYYIIYIYVYSHPVLRERGREREIEEGRYI